MGLFGAGSKGQAGGNTEGQTRKANVQRAAKAAQRGGSGVRAARKSCPAQMVNGGNKTVKLRGQ